jgi:Zn-finger nucleic acid-binding protein
MLCPSHRLQLQVRSVEGHSGYVCQSCYGIWLPRKYIASVAYSYEFQTAAFDSALTNFKTPSSVPCPQKCGQLIRGSYEEVTLHYCSSCMGAWFAEGEVTRLLARHNRKTQSIGGVLAKTSGESILGSLLGGLIS